MAIKELSKATHDAFLKNRVKVKDLVDCQEIVTLIDNMVYTGSVCRCDTPGCPAVGLVNAMPVSAHVSEKKLQGMTFAFSRDNLVPDSVGCYDADGSGDAICESCAAARDAKRTG